MCNFLKTLLSSFILFISSCSNPQPVNQWQYDAATLSQHYQHHFLQKKELRASLDLKHARKAASHSAKLSTLIDIELTVCAMELISFNPTPCQRAVQLLEIEPDENQHAYLHLLTSELSQEEIPLLPDQYQEFASAYIDNNASMMNKALLKMTPITSKLISSSLSRESINEENLLKLINELSHHGYKNPLLRWLEFQMQNEEDLLEKKRLEQKIEVLNSH